jgi:hypothetical protein
MHHFDELVLEDQLVLLLPQFLIQTQILLVILKIMKQQLLF